MSQCETEPGRFSVFGVGDTAKNPKIPMSINGPIYTLFLHYPYNLVILVTSDKDMCQSQDVFTA